MQTFDVDEYERWLATAEQHLTSARHSAAGGFNSTAVLLGEQAAQCGLKALLHGVGAPHAARGHGLLSLAEAAAALGGLALETQHRDQLNRLARDYQSTRYPDALPEGTPGDHYGAADAELALDAALGTLDAVRAAWTALQAAADPARDT